MSKTGRFITLSALLAGILFATWRHGFVCGQKKGTESTAARFQVMLDSNLYWAHRDSLGAMSSGEEHAIQKHRSALETYHGRGMSAADRSQDLDAMIKNNFISRVGRQFPEDVETAERLLDRVRNASATRSNSKERFER